MIRSTTFTKFHWLFFYFISFSIVSAQIIDPINLTTSIEPIGEDTFEIQINATIDKGWHLYSMDEQEGGLPTALTFEPNNNYTLVETVYPVGYKHVVFSEVFDTELKYYSDSVSFRQKIKRVSQQAFDLNLEVFYQLCDDSKCLAPNTLTFSVSIPTSKSGKKTDPKQTPKDKVDSLTTLDNLHPQNNLDSISAVSPKTISADNPDTSSDASFYIPHTLKVRSIDKQKPLSDCTTEKVQATKSLWTVFGLGFLGGLLAILMPCVFPMIPLTVSFFTKGMDRKKGIAHALLYGFFIILIYLLLSLPFLLFEGVSANILNQISTNFWLNLAFFIVFIVFALSFFGFYEITLPNSWATKTDTSSNKGGLLGSFFMALTLAIVSFSCTGPILGLLLVEAISTNDNAIFLTIAMLGFGTALALPFTLFALFPSMLNKLPKSGGWMNTLKVVIGFLELALAMKFLSKADLVGINGPMELLKKEIFIVIWLILCLLMLLYLFKIIRFPHDDASNKKVSWRRWSLASVVVVFMIYLATGLPKDGNLRSLSGLVPPSNYSLFEDKTSLEDLEVEHKHGITIYKNNLEKALLIAKREHKPLLLDFTGYGCENCRRMEDYVWVDPRINTLLKNKFVVLSLYVDSSETLSESEQQEVTLTYQRNMRRKLKTVGDKWSIFQAENFNNNAQPNYALLTSDGILINQDISGYKEAEEFEAFLSCGLDTFHSLP